MEITMINIKYVSTKQMMRLFCRFLRIMPVVGLTGFILFYTGCLGQAAPKRPMVQEPSEIEAVEGNLADTPEGQDQSEMSPQIVFENLEYDFGDITPNSQNKATFTFSNQGSGELLIKEIKKCCGAVIKLDKRRFAPKEKAVMTAEYRTTASPGPMKKYIYIITNDPNKPNIQLTIKGQVVLKVVWEPERFRLTLEKENGGCPDLTIYSLDDKPFAIKSFMCTSDCISIDFDPNETSTKYVFHPRVDLEKLKDNLKGRVLIELNRPDCDIININYDVLPNYGVNPPQIFIMGAEPDKKEIKSVIVFDNYPDANGQADFTIASTSSEMGTARVVDTSPIKTGYRLSIEVTPPQPQGKRKTFFDQLFIKTHDGEELSVLVRGYYSSKVFSEGTTPANPSSR